MKALRSFVSYVLLFAFTQFAAAQSSPDSDPSSSPHTLLGYTPRSTAIERDLEKEISGYRGGRSSMYGSFLSGGFSGHVYGAEGIWGADVEPVAPIKMWDAFQWNSARQYLRAFAMSIGKRYQELVLDVDLVSPDKDHNLEAYEGWAYCARTPDKEIFLLYFREVLPDEPRSRCEAVERVSRGLVRSA